MRTSRGPPGLRSPGRPPRAGSGSHASRRIAKPASDRPPDGSVCAKPALSFHLASNAACPPAENGNRWARAGHVDPTWRTPGPFFLRDVCICLWEDLEVIVAQLYPHEEQGQEAEGAAVSGQIKRHSSGQLSSR
nr:unnamed protein product [Rangifer tarandus platyrhynchus]